MFRYFLIILLRSAEKYMKKNKVKNMNRFFRLFIVSVLAIFTLIGCERKQTEIIDHYHNQAFTNKYAKDLTVTDCEYEQIRIGYGRNGDYSLGPTDPRYRGVIKISEEQARELNSTYKWIYDDTFTSFDLGSIDTSSLQGEDWYFCNQFENDYFSMVNRYFVRFNGKDTIVFDVQTF